MSFTNGLLGTLMSLPALNYNFMNTLDKYRSIIDKIQEMCTSTVALAPYPVGPVSDVTEVRYKSSKGAKESKMPKTRKAIVETMLELTELCEKYYLHGKTVSGDEFRAFMEKQRQNAEALQQRLNQKKGSQKTIDKILGTLKKWKAIAKGTESTYTNERYSDPEYTIPRGNKKRVQNNMNRYTNRALDRNPDAKYMQKQAVAAFVKMMKAKVGSGRKKLSPEELEAAKDIYKFAPANMDPQEREKYQKAVEQKKKYSSYMRKAKTK